MDLEDIEQEIEERESEIEKLEEEIKELYKQKAEYIRENCDHRNKIENKCEYFDEDLDFDECCECSTHLSIGQIKR